MEKVIIAPSKYVQGPGAIHNLAKYVKNNAIVIADEFVTNLVKTDVENSFKKENLEVCFEKFNGECSTNEINRIRESIKGKNIKAIVGIGGGKTLDTAKAVAYYEELPIVVVPTIASTDAPCSALSVIYTDNGVFESYLFLPHNPNVVLMDTSIIANAPTRLLVAGMGDALATYFEARASLRSNSTAMSGGLATNASMALAKLCYDTLISEGELALASSIAKVSTKSLENIVEANTFLSGVGFESAGLAAAHAIHNGLTVIEDLHHLYHGEKVAFGTIVQLVLENAPEKEILEVVNFCQSVGLPTTLKELGLKSINKELLMEVAKLATAEGETIHNMPFKVTADLVYSAILAADSYVSNFVGESYSCNEECDCTCKDGTHQDNCQCEDNCC